MRGSRTYPTLFVAVTWCATVWAQPTAREAHIGYLYPSGAQQGATVQILVGGQSMVGAKDAYISGEGVHATVVKTYRPLRNLSKEQQTELRRRMTESWDRRLAEQKGNDPGPLAPRTIELPDHPLIDSLDTLSLRELAHVRHELLNLRKRQPNPQIAEMALVEVTADATAEPGARDFRLVTRTGLTNPLEFEIGVLPEVRELEPNEPTAPPELDADRTFDLPVLLNGQIMPGDVDRFRIHARQGQHLVLRTEARQLVPYLADAVPGWFQAVLALYDDAGREVAYADDFRFSPDPSLVYDVPKDGVYTVEIRDSIYRGREDFVYRVAVGEEPFVTGIFPLGGRQDRSVSASLDGYNLDQKHMTLATGEGPEIRQVAVPSDPANPITYAVDDLPESKEVEPNNTCETAQSIEVRRIVNGRIGEPGDIDIFKIEGAKDEQLVVDVAARRLDSPVDSLVRLIDANGSVVAWNDDGDAENIGLTTHHADSYLLAALPTDGVYFVQLSDAQDHGGKDYAYRVRIAPPEPDFAVWVTPSCVNVPAGRAAPVTIHVARKDGFDGPVDVVVNDPATGVTLDGGRIEADRDTVRATLTAPNRPITEPVAIALEARADVGGHTVGHPVVPAEDMMQAFLYRHLVPAREFLLMTVGRQTKAPPVKLTGLLPVRVPLGGTAEVHVKAPAAKALKRVQLRLDDPPEGVTVGDVTLSPNGLVFALQADAVAAKPGVSDNLIVEAYAEMEQPARDGKPARIQRVSYGYLPAIPCEIVPR